MDYRRRHSKLLRYNTAPEVNESGTEKCPRPHGVKALRGKDESHPYNRGIPIPRIQDHKGYRGEGNDDAKGTHTRKRHQKIPIRSTTNLSPKHHEGVNSGKDVRHQSTH